MHTAEKLTPTFIVKLVVLFALLLIGVFHKTNNISQTSELNNATNFTHPTTTDSEHTTIKQVEYKLTKHSNSNDSAI